MHGSSSTRHGRTPSYERSHTDWEPTLTSRRASRCSRSVRGCAICVEGDAMSRSEAAAVLRRVLEDPIYNKTLRKEVGRGELDYEVYLRTRELLALQTPADELVVP